MALQDYFTHFELSQSNIAKAKCFTALQSYFTHRELSKTGAKAMATEGNSTCHLQAEVGFSQVVRAIKLIRITEKKTNL